MEDGVFVILDTNLNEELIKEGYMREFISKVQQMRKSSGFEVTDEIEISYDADEELVSALESYRDEIMSETLAKKFEPKELACDKIELNDKEIAIELKRL